LLHQCRLFPSGLPILFLYLLFLSWPKSWVHTDRFIYMPEFACLVRIRKNESKRNQRPHPGRTRTGHDGTMNPLCITIAVSSTYDLLALLNSRKLRYLNCVTVFMNIAVCNYGGIITRIDMPDRNGKIGNIVASIRRLKDAL
jgi:hypothetical protein